MSKTQVKCDVFEQQKKKRSPLVLPIAVVCCGLIAAGVVMVVDLHPIAEYLQIHIPR